ncbi:arylsulfatase [Aestuariicella hydrocarbonica]|uniref:Arylsulfatase n=1 Tax=Pseudomaricurvus hydrocarbonicus TaxID=1470433 RepID=A0A9E5ML75_9GAMM|nr:arylsulfatase [Aestuariicella hydrocarbonica]NHO66532.1 arylsulfatase [Aestuariicella hydrocarbonica]
MRRALTARRALAVTALVGLGVVSTAALAADKPNILVIFGDDIGQTNISAYSHGLMGYKTPNIDSLAREGMMFTDYYAEQSCTAGRSAFITGQIPVRTGLTKVGTPGADTGIQKEDPTLAEMLKPLGYATGQFGKNHLGDRNEFLPTNHGFDEFFGNLYHLDAEEMPEMPDYPQEAWFQKTFNPRGVIHSYADGRVEDSGPLTRKRMETVDEEFVAGAKNFISKAHKAKKPFFVWLNTTGMHYWTHPAEKNLGKSGQGFYNDVMVTHDEHVGEMLQQLKDLGIEDNTIVIYSTDNGPHYNTWPDAAITPFRSEKNTNWEGGFRVPALVRWPGKIAPGQVSNSIMSHLDWLPTLMAAVGEDQVVSELKKGRAFGNRDYKVHLDGHNFLPYLKGEENTGPRTEFFYFSDDGAFLGVRSGDWKVVYAEQRARKFDVWREPFVRLRIPKIFNLRRDPFERADTDANNYNTWWENNAGRIFYGSAKAVQFAQTFKEFPSRQAPNSFTVDGVVEQLTRYQPQKAD